MRKLREESQCELWAEQIIQWAELKTRSAQRWNKNSEGKSAQRFTDTKASQGRNQPLENSDQPRCWLWSETIETKIELSPNFSSFIGQSKH